jgi:endoglucanase
MKDSTCGRSETCLRWSFCLTRVIASALICFLAYSAKGQTTDLFLSANGVNVRNGHGTGDVVPLRGVNLGGWLVMEGWMCPMDTGSHTDMYSLTSTLDNNFGTNIEQSLIRTYQYNWITANDLANIRKMGMNVVRVPVWWGNFETLAGVWRADAFDRLDWVVSNAWERGIYTVIDMHGVVGGQSTSASTGQMNQNQYWNSTADQNATATIWSNIAAHYSGNPGVAAYDLINEPYGSPNDSTLWTMYTSLYQTIRSADPSHIIIMEGGYNGLGDLPSPQSHSWSNVIYSAHEYEFSDEGSVSGIEAGINNQVSYYDSHQYWSVPDFIGEFNCFSPGGGCSGSALGVWEYAATNFDNNNMSWTPWTYKATHGSSGSCDSWGLYDPSSTFPTVPNIASDPSGTISNDWYQNNDIGFGINATLQRSLGAPLAVADSYTATSGVTLVVSSPGVLANDLDINNGQSGIQMTAVLVAGPSNGTLTLNSNGSFQYTSTAGFSGTDTFRYSVYDGYADSVNIATVTIQVITTLVPPGWTDQDIGSPSPAGQGQYSASTGIWTVSGGGAGIGGTSDQFNYLWEDYTGDGNLIAEVTSLQATNSGASAGIMFRGDVGTGTAFASVVVTSGGVNFEWRNFNNGSGSSVQVAGIAPPVWVMLTRSGGSGFSGYYSMDGTNWTEIGTAQTISGLSAEVLAGLAVTSGSSGTLNTATFTNVSVTPLTAYQQWQVQYFPLGVTDPNAAAGADPDGDGMSNLQEFLAGTDPTNGASYLHITSISFLSNGVNVAWMGGGGTTNVVQATAAMGGAYSNISPNIVLPASGTSTTTNYLDSGTLTVISGAASDNASDPAYTGGNFNGANGGTGFNPWVVSPAPNTGNAQWFIASSSTNGYNPPTGNIDSTGGKSWGSFANNAGTGTAVRVFSAGALVPSQVFSVDMDNGYVEAGDSVGINLQNSSGQTLLQVNYVGGNAAGDYAYVDSGGSHSLGVAYTDGGLHAHITLTSATTYSGSLIANDGSIGSFSGTLINPSGGQGISQIQLFDNNVAAANSGANWMVFWNNFNVTSVTNTVNTGVANAAARYYRVFLVQ